MYWLIGLYALLLSVIILLVVEAGLRRRKHPRQPGGELSSLAIERVKELEDNIASLQAGILETRLAYNAMRDEWASVKGEQGTFVELRIATMPGPDDDPEKWAKGKTPIVIGGSAFYLKSIFFPPAAMIDIVEHLTAVIRP